MKENILDYFVDAKTVDECVEDIFRKVNCSNENNLKCFWLACLNPHSYYVALKDRKFHHALREANWLIADGIGLIFASRMLGGKIRERVTGSDIFEKLHGRLNSAGKFKVFFLGSSDETLAMINLRMAKEYPNIIVVGTFSPPFKSFFTSDEVELMIQAINLSKADVLWVGMTAPKQEKWLQDNHTKLNVKFAGAVGAVFDFYAGKVKRSHPLFRRYGFEWLPRLIQQPLRLWRRIFISAPIFLLHVMKKKILRS
jgi:N-acetylglucosaminyldiphosphoundecaprenol N-acetyl-beta-D-mannosaminyltransferase